MVHAKELKQYAAQCLAELYGTFLLILIGDAAVAQYKFTRQPTQMNLPIHICFGIGTYVALMVAGPISGAHLNPALSLGLLSLGKLKFIQCLFYITGQLVGAFLGALAVYVLYISEFNMYDGGIRQIDGANATADIFYTEPSRGVPNWNCLIDQLISTSLLLKFVRALDNDDNHLISNTAKPFAFVLMITAIGSGMNLNCGYPLNPARDFGPRLFTAWVYGMGVFRINNYYFWVPIIGPILGAIIGVWTYEGYTFLMKRYANLTSTAHIETAEKPIQEEFYKIPRKMTTQISSESATLLLK